MLDVVEMAKWCWFSNKKHFPNACNISNRIPFFFFALWLILKVFTQLDGGATYVDSDTGLESMSSAEATTKACSLCLDGVVASSNMMVPPEANIQIEGLKHEVTRLKCDKLDLLRQNVVSILLVECLQRFTRRLKGLHFCTLSRNLFFESWHWPFCFRLNSRHAKGTLNDYANVNCHYKGIWLQRAKKFYDYVICWKNICPAQHRHIQFHPCK